MKNLNCFMMGVALSVIALSGCSNDEQLSGMEDARTPLAISVTNAGLTEVGGGSFWKPVALDT